MPKAHKFTLGERWTETCLDVTSLLVDASFIRDKLPLLAQAARGLTRAGVIARLHNANNLAMRAHVGRRQVVAREL